MNWISKLLGVRPNNFRNAEFSLRIESIFRENISVSYTRGSKYFNFEGERFGKKWGAIQVFISQDIDQTELQQLVRDLETALKAMRFEYVIVRRAGVEIISAEEQQAALAELQQMGYDVTVSPDRRQIRQTHRPDAPLRDKATLRKIAPRMLALTQTLRGKRQRFEVFARSANQENNE